MSGQTSRINNYSNDILPEYNLEGSNLETLLLAHIHGNIQGALRKSQKNALMALGRALAEQITPNLIVLPMGEGKTRLMIETFKATKLRTLIVVPSSHLLSQIHDKFIEAEVNPEEIRILGSAKKIPLSHQLEDMFAADQSTKEQVVLLTYKGLISLHDRSNAVWSALVAWAQSFVMDEAHDSLGDRSQEIISPILTQKDKTHLFLTATPDLLNKNVQEIYGLPILYQSRLEDSFKESTLILPSRVDLGTATYFVDDTRTAFQDSELEQLAGQSKFRLEDGREIIDESIAQYKKLQKEHGHLPALCACGTIAQAERETEYFIKHGIRAVRVSSGNDEYEQGWTPEKAKMALERGEQDVVVGVGQTMQGWDVPMLRVLMSHTPTQSPARYFQRLGRVLRSYSDEGFVKTSSNTFVFEPRWQILPVTQANSKKDSKEVSYLKTTEKHSFDPENLIEALTMYDFMLETGQVSEDYLKSRIDLETQACIYSRKEFYTRILRKYVIENNISPFNWMFHIGDIWNEKRVPFQIENKYYKHFARYLGIDNKSVRDELTHLRIGEKIFQDLYNMRVFPDDYVFQKTGIVFSDLTRDYLETFPLMKERALAKQMTREEFVQYVREAAEKTGIIPGTNGAYPAFSTKDKGSQYVISAHRPSHEIEHYHVSWSRDFFHGLTLDEVADLFDLTERTDRNMLLLNILLRIFPKQAGGLCTYVKQAKEKDLSTVSEITWLASVNEVVGALKHFVLQKYSFMDFINLSFKEQMALRREISKYFDRLDEQTSMRGYTLDRVLDHLGVSKKITTKNQLALGLHLYSEDKTALRVRAIQKNSLRFLTLVNEKYGKDVNSQTIVHMNFFGISSVTLQNLLNIEGDMKEDEGIRNTLVRKITTAQILPEDQLLRSLQVRLASLLDSLDLEELLHKEKKFHHLTRVDCKDILSEMPYQEETHFYKLFSRKPTLKAVLSVLDTPDYTYQSIIDCVSRLKQKESPVKYIGDKSRQMLQEQVSYVEDQFGMQIVPDSVDIYNKPAGWLKENFALRFAAYTNLLRVKGNPQEIQQVVAYYKPRLQAIASLHEYIHIHHEDEQLLKPDQLNILSNLLEMLENNMYEGYVKLPTGFGKTVIFIKILEVLGKQALVVLPTKVLVEQTIVKMKRFAPELRPKVIIGTRIPTDSSLYLTTYSSLVEMHKNNTLPKGLHALILDEAHESLSKKRRDAVNTLDSAIKLGFTATPKYDEGKQVDMLLSHEIAHVSIPEAVESGHLAPFRVIIVHTDVDLRSVSLTSSGDYKEGELEQAINIHSRNAAAVKLYKEMFMGEKSMAFCATIRHAETVAALFVEHGIKATWVSGELMQRNPDEYARRMLAYETGDTLVLCSADLLTRGYDHPATSVGLMLAPSRSAVKVEQRGGRTTRLDDNNPLKVATIVEFFDKTSAQNRPLSFANVVGKAAVIPQNTSESSSLRKKVEDLDVKLREVSLGTELRFEITAEEVMKCCTEIAQEYQDTIIGKCKISDLSQLLKLDTVQVREYITKLDPDLKELHPNSYLPSEVVVQLLAEHIVLKDSFHRQEPRSLLNTLYHITEGYEDMELPNAQSEQLFAALLALRMQLQRVDLESPSVRMYELHQQVFSIFSQMLTLEYDKENADEYFESWWKIACKIAAKRVNTSEQDIESATKVIKMYPQDIVNDFFDIESFIDAQKLTSFNKLMRTVSPNTRQYRRHDNVIARHIISSRFPDFLKVMSKFTYKYRIFDSIPHTQKVFIKLNQAIERTQVLESYIQQIYSLGYIYVQMKALSNDISIYSKKKGLGNEVAAALHSGNIFLQNLFVFWKSIESEISGLNQYNPIIYSFNQTHLKRDEYVVEIQSMLAPEKYEIFRELWNQAKKTL